MKVVLVYLIFIAITFLCPCNGYRILGVFPLNGISHQITFEALMKGLAKHGHQVDVISHYPLKRPVKNYNDIINLSGILEELTNNCTIEFVHQILQTDIVSHVAHSLGNQLCHLMSNEHFQKLIKNPPNDPPYDLIITEAFAANCYMGLGYVFNVSVVAITSSVDYAWISDLIGNNDNLAIVPNTYHINPKRMNFWERFKNVITHYRAVYKFRTITEKSQTESMRKYLKPDIPNIREVERNVALILVKRHHILFGVKPITPALVQIAGLHIEGNDDILPAELKKWMDDSKFGVIYFTLGSMILIESIATEKIYAIYASFKKIAPIRVLMKIADSSKLPPGLPENIKTLPWMPQQPILAHPNTKIFITHAGLGGVEEALYYGVPMIGIPMFNDQFRNTENFVAKGMMIRIDLDEISEKSLDSALDKILNDPNYKNNATFYSRLFRDQPISPLKTAIFWIEFVIRNGGNVLKSPALYFSWWQLALLDVYGTILLILILSFVLIILCIRLIIKYLSKTIHCAYQKKKKNN